MSTEPRVSVVLPTYNAREYLPTAVQSLRNQTLADFEVLVVDDGSTDGTVEYIQEIDDDRFRLLQRTNPAGGLPGALNHGIEQARSEYVARQDADDISAPERLQRQVTFLNDHPDVALVGTAVEFIDSAGDVGRTRVPLADPSFEELLEKNRFVHGSVVARRSVLRDVGGYDTGFEYTEDYDLWLRIAATHPVRNIQTPLYRLRLHEDSIYGAHLRTVKLFGRFARKRITGESDVDVEAINDAGIEIVYEHLSPAEQVAFETELARELLRYSDFSGARRACRRGLAVSRASPMLWILLALSYMPEQFVDAVVASYRRVLNRRSR